MAKARLMQVVVGHWSLPKDNNHAHNNLRRSLHSCLLYLYVWQARLSEQASGLRFGNSLFVLVLGYSDPRRRKQGAGSTSWLIIFDLTRERFV